MTIVIVWVAIISQPSNNTDALLTCPRFSGKFMFQILHLAIPQRTLRLLEQTPDIVFLNEVPSQTNAFSDVGTYAGMKTFNATIGLDVGRDPQNNVAPTCFWARPSTD